MKKVVVPLLTSVALLLNLMLPFFAVYHSQQASAAPVSAESMATLFDEKVLICTSEGFKWVRWADIVDGSEPLSPHPQYQCALCYIAAHGISHMLPSGVLEADMNLLSMHHSRNRFFSEHPIQTQLLPGSRLSRAPPLTALT